MKVGTVALIVMAGSTPVLASAGVDWVKMDDVEDVLGGQNVTSVAQRIAEREFTPNVTLRFLSVEATDRVKGEFGETIRADEGKSYHRYSLVVANGGRLDMSIHTHHFWGFDDVDRKYRPEWGIADKFESLKLPTGDERAGTIVFLLPDDVRLERILWQGELANATLDLRTPLPPTASAP